MIDGVKRKKKGIFRRDFLGIHFFFVDQNRIMSSRKQTSSCGRQGNDGLIIDVRNVFLY